MSELTELFAGAGDLLFGLAAVLFAVFLLRILCRLDRIIALAEMEAIDRLPAIVRRLLGKQS